MSDYFLLQMAPSQLQMTPLCCFSSLLQATLLCLTFDSCSQLHVETYIASKRADDQLADLPLWGGGGAGDPYQQHIKPR